MRRGRNEGREERVRRGGEEGKREGKKRKGGEGRGRGERGEGGGSLKMGLGFSELRFDSMGGAGLCCGCCSLSCFVGSFLELF